MTDKNLMQQSHAIEENEHLNVKFFFRKDERLSDVENLKIKIIKDIISFYKKYPTLHSISFTYYEKDFGNAHLGWNSSISQIAWDSVASITKTQEFKESKVNLYAFCNNEMIKKRDLNVIPFGQNDFTSYEKIKEELKNHFCYLVEHPQLSLNLRNILNQQVEQDYEKNRFHIDCRTWFGGKNTKIDDDIKYFFGKDMMSNILHLKLQDELPDKLQLNRKKKI